MELRRRAFLRQVCLALAGLGISETGLSLAGSRYRHVLAQPTRRKLALLIGINRYATQHKVPALSGCLTDVALQRELLIHRFGFQPSDILILEDQQATRSNIETAFITHLVEQARPDDVVVFHFSGYGRQACLGSLQDNETAGFSEQNTLVPVDSVLFLSNQEVPVINDLLEETLLLLLRSLQTEQITSILDTGYSYPGSSLKGNLRVRSRPNLAKGQAPVAELALQEQLLSQADFSREQVGVQRRSRQMPGVVLAASGPGQLAAEAQWHRFQAGLFTYALTQHLWSTTPATTIRTSLSRVTADIQIVGGQQPELMGQKSYQRPLLAYNLSPGVGADGVVTAVEDNSSRNISLWLAGLPAEVLERYNANSILTALSTQNREQFIQLRSLKGLNAKGQFLGSGVQVGQLVQEAIRVLPHNLDLTVALDAGLDRVERVDATSAFSGISQVSSVIAGEQPADYVFAKAQEVMPSQSQSADDSRQVLAGNISLPQSSYGLFSLGREVIPNTVGKVGEAAKVAVRRLTPKLQTLLASKWLGLTVNESSSCLGVSATLEIIPEEQILIRQETSRAPWSLPQTSTGDSRTVSPVSPKAERDGTLVTLPVGSRIQYRVHNYSDRPIYLVLLGLDSSANGFAFYPFTSATSTEATKSLLKQARIGPGKTLTVPQVSDSFEWVVRGPTGLTIAYLVLSCGPFDQTLAALETVTRQVGDIQQIAALSNLLEVTRGVLQDLKQASTLGTGSKATAKIPEEALALDVNAWATLRFIYRVI